jgi:lysozyme
MGIDRIHDLLIRHESVQLKPYYDSVGKLTIGIGRNLTDVGISLETAFQMLDEDLRQVEADLSTFPWFLDMDPVRQDAMRDFRFNLGAGGMRTFKNTLAELEAKHYDAAADRLLASKWARQVKGRAVTLAEMVRHGRDT